MSHESHHFQNELDIFIRDFGEKHDITVAEIIGCLYLAMHDIAEVTSAQTKKPPSGGIEEAFGNPPNG